MRNRAEQNAAFRENLLIYIFIAAGVVLRIYYFLLNRSLWIDEVYLSSSILIKDLQGLVLGDLLYYQKAPLLFLSIQKLFTTIFTPNEFSLRLFPLICGIVSLFLFVPVAKHFLSKKFTWLSIALLALAAPLIYHSGEAKPYACDILASCLMLFTFVKTMGDTNGRAAFWLAVMGIILIWLSFPVIFILAGIGLSLVIPALRSKNKKQILTYSIMILRWCASFLISYFLIAKKYTASEWTVYWFDSYGYFTPLIPRNPEELKRPFLQYYWMFDYPMGLWWRFTALENTPLAPLLKIGAVLPPALFLCGLYQVLKEKKYVLLLLAPFVFTILASSLKLYPLKDRFWVFMAPVIAIIIVKGLALVTEKLKSRFLKIVLIIIILAGPVSTSLQLFVNQNLFMASKKSSQREALHYVQSNFREGDVAYVYYTAQPGYKVYKTLYHYSFPTILGKDVRFESNNYDEYFRKIKRGLGDLSGTKRIWLIFNYTFQSDIGEDVDAPKWYFKIKKPTDNVVKWFETMGPIVAEQKRDDTHVYCFQINN